MVVSLRRIRLAIREHSFGQTSDEPDGRGISRFGFDLRGLERGGRPKVVLMADASWQLDLNALVRGDIDRIVGLETSERHWNCLERVFDDVLRECSAQVLRHYAREGAILSPHQNGVEHVRTMKAVERDHCANAVTERMKLGRFFWPETGGRNVPTKVVRLTYDVEGPVTASGGLDRDVIGARLEVTPMKRHDPEVGP